MGDFDLGWGMEHDLHVDHDGGVDHLLADNHHYDQHDFSDGSHDATGAHDLGDVAEADQHEEPLRLDGQELDVPEWQLDTEFLDGHYDLVGADPDENDMWSQFMSDMHEEINPYAAQ
ncbi:hypothetical protein ABT297_26815 [Dactylosporangium sp. NPDC000555]|uniref:hypothetical protein n=1 Tax=Dactylosporangium sp. NPDC000555 TaxID=3154260 RepID=UPI0033231E83